MVSALSSATHHLLGCCSKNSENIDTDIPDRGSVNIVRQVSTDTSAMNMHSAAGNPIRSITPIESQLTSISRIPSCHLEESASDPNSLLIANYNTFLRPRFRFGVIPLFSDWQVERCPKLGEFSNSFEVVLFNEVFDNQMEHKLRSSLLKPFVYKPPMSDGLVFTNSGLLLASNWPILENDYHTFQSSSFGGDWFAYKAVLYAKINKCGQPYHLFGTHMQSGMSEKEAETRLQQIEEISGFIAKQRIPGDEPVILLGDLNIDRLGSPKEYSNMLQTLNLKDTLHQPCYASISPEDNTFGKNGREPEQLLDHILFAENHPHPSSKLNYQCKPSTMINGKQVDLSDHYGVGAWLKYGAQQQYNTSFTRNT